MIKKLVCDRCGKQLTEKKALETALRGEQVWAGACQARDDKPRGLLPCENYVRCGGEMKPVLENGLLWWRWCTRKLLGR